MKKVGIEVKQEFHILVKKVQQRLFNRCWIFHIGGLSINNQNRLHPCPCCNYETLASKSPGSFEICSICDWEDDNIQFDNPYYEGGANNISLYQARRNFLSNK